MVSFTIYLLETGICLSLLYLAYWLFLRKETYFNFNRIYLVGSIVLALMVPLLHLSLDIPLGSALENPARSVSSFRTGYEELISLLEADFGTEPGKEHMFSEGSVSALSEPVGEYGTVPREGKHGESLDNESGKENDSEGSKASVSRILLLIYIGGVFYFFSRFVYLVIRLYLLVKRNGVTRQDGFRMVEINEQISPFSFFRYLFINNGSFNESELHHVLEHEKAHIRQRHTSDHLFAHGLAVFQWFNPFAWQMRKALKTTHEYIADRQVLDKGFERIDYQALLLKQVIGYHSVELVNNFNLKPIKKRIAMMNKNKSGLPAKLKATLVAPFAILVFFLFADFTLKGNEHEAYAVVGELQGLWIGQTREDVNHSLLISENHFTYNEGVKIRDFKMRMGNRELILSDSPGQGEIALRYELIGNRLSIWWKDDHSSTYFRSESENTLDHLLTKHDMQMKLPYISQYRLLEDETKIYRLGMNMNIGGDVILSFDGQPIQLSDLPGFVQKKKDQLNKIDQGSLTAIFLVDRKVPMAEVDKVRQTLRKIEALHIAEGGYPQGDLNLSPLIYHAVALPRVLPPLNAKMVEKKDREKLGSKLLTIDLGERNTTPRDLDVALREFIGNQSEGKYVISLEFDGDIPYGQYVESVDMVWRTVYAFRNKLAMDRYNVPYEKLGDEVQREIRKAYPMALSETFK